MYVYGIWNFLPTIKNASISFTMQKIHNFFLAKTCEIPKDVLDKKAELRVLKIPTRTIVPRFSKAIKSYTIIKKIWIKMFNLKNPLDGLTSGTTDSI